MDPLKGPGQVLTVGVSRGAAEEFLSIGNIKYSPFVVYYHLLGPNIGGGGGVGLILGEGIRA